MSGIQVQWLADGRLHLNHGPIDLICQAWGDDAACDRAVARFDGLLAELVAELPALRAEGAAALPTFFHVTVSEMASRPPTRPTLAERSLPAQRNGERRVVRRPHQRREALEDRRPQ